MEKWPSGEKAPIALYKSLKEEEGGEGLISWHLDPSIICAPAPQSLDFESETHLPKQGAALPYFITWSDRLPRPLGHSGSLLHHSVQPGL